MAEQNFKQNLKHEVVQFIKAKMRIFETNSHTKTTIKNNENYIFFKNLEKAHIAMFQL